MAKNADKFMAVLSIVMGVLILIRPELLNWIIAIYLIVWGLSRLF